MSQRLPRDLLQQAFPNLPRLWRAFEDQDAIVADQAQRLPSLETKVAVVDGNASAAIAAATTAQPANPILSSIAAIQPDAGVIEQVSTGSFAIRPVDQQDKASLLSRALGDTRYLGALQAAPATSSSAGTPGRMAYDANYLYVCVAANSWRRIALTTF